MSKFEIRPRVTSFIDGHFVDPSVQAHPIAVIDPSTAQPLTTLYEADAQEVDAAVRAARRSFERGSWRNASTRQRTTVLRRIAALVQAHAEELCWLETMDLGVPRSLAPAVVTALVVRNFNFYADHLSQAAERAARSDALYQQYVYRDPVGVCALLSPWNAPLMLASSKIAPALAFGNSFVVKTSEYTPLALARFMELLVEAGVPPGVANLVNGRGQVSGAALVAHPQVDLVSFTGGGVAGRQIAAAAGAGLKKCDLELGGKSANIVSDGADLEAAVDGSLASIFTNSGQMCFAGSRILVQAAVADAFIERFVARARAIRVGDPHAVETEMGPLAYEAHCERVLSFCASDAGAGVQLIAGGRRLDRPGFFVEPTVLLAQSAAARCVREEIFGPVASIMKYERFDEAIAIANDSRYGLAAYLWTNRLDECTQAAAGLRAGSIMVNSPMWSDLRMPFGGVQDSGVGREGIESLRNFYSEEKTVAIATGKVPLRRFGVGG